MRKSTPKGRLTEKEEELMRLLWEHGPMPISKLLGFYSDPKPHFNTVSTVMRRLESKGFVSHDEAGGTFVYHAVAKKEDFRSRNFGDFIMKYFGGSYYGAVSALVAEEKISAEELRELLDLLEHKKEE